MLCAIDADGRAPLSSGCNGDSGGPVYSGTDRRPRLLGVISWGGARCGADHLPSVSAEVARYRDFVLAPNPVWEPRATSPAVISGDSRVGGTLTCTPPAFDAPVDAVTFQWRDRDFAVVATGPSYTVQARDSGRDISCEVTATHGRRPHNHHRHDDRAVTPIACLRRPGASAAHASTRQPLRRGHGCVVKT